jgi:hypothetical protein
LEEESYTRFSLQEQKTWTAAIGGANGPPTMLIDYWWVWQLALIVTCTSFGLYAVYLLPVHYCDLLHRSASHLGRWIPVEPPPPPAAPQHLPAGIAPILVANQHPPVCYPT